MSTRRALVFSFIDRYASLAINIGSTMVLARLLTPAEVGAYSVAMALLALVSSVRDLGAGQYLLQERVLTPERIRAVWSVQLGLGVLLGCAILAGSKPLVRFYAEPALTDILVLLAWGYFVNPLGAVTYAWLMREMRYDSIAVIRFASTIAGAVISIWLAYRGHGPVSLAWGNLGSALVGAMVSLFFRPRGYPWLPGIDEIGRVLSFGTKLTFSSMLTSAATSAPEFFLGKLQNFAAAGFYSRANGLVSLFNRLVTDAVSAVAVSLFSKEAREQRDTRMSFLTATAHITALSWSFCVALACLAHPVVRLLYGPQWDDSVDLARLLAAALVFATPVHLCLVALVGLGEATRVLRLTITTTAISVTLSGIGAGHGLIGLGTLLVFNAALAAAIWLWATRRVIGFAWIELWCVTRRSMVVAACAGGVPLLSLFVFGSQPSNHFAPLVFGIPGAALGFLVGVYMSGHPVRSEIGRLLTHARSTRSQET